MVNQVISDMPMKGQFENNYIQKVQCIIGVYTNASRHISFLKLKFIYVKSKPIWKSWHGTAKHTIFWSHKAQFAYNSDALLAISMCAHA